MPSGDCSHLVDDRGQPGSLSHVPEVLDARRTAAHRDRGLSQPILPTTHLSSVKFTRAVVQIGPTLAVVVRLSEHTRGVVAHFGPVR